MPSWNQTLLGVCELFCHDLWIQGLMRPPIIISPQSPPWLQQAPAAWQPYRAGAAQLSPSLTVDNLSRCTMVISVRWWTSILPKDVHPYWIAWNLKAEKPLLSGVAQCLRLSAPIRIPISLETYHWGMRKKD